MNNKANKIFTKREWKTPEVFVPGKGWVPAPIGNETREEKKMITGLEKAIKGMVTDNKLHKVTIYNTDNYTVKFHVTFDAADVLGFDLNRIVSDLHILADGSVHVNPDLTLTVNKIDWDMAEVKASEKIMYAKN